MQPVSLPPASLVCLDLANECLRYGTQTISLRPKTFAVLRCLIEHADQLVSKTALLEAVWPETMVSDGVLMVCIRELRQALRGYPETFSHYRNEITQHPGGNETRSDRWERFYSS